MEEVKGDPKLTFGCELEWSDIDRRIGIPEKLGAWEGPMIGGYAMGSELDIVNTKDTWKGVAVDPLCRTCPVGGEIHTVPSETIESQMYRIMRIMDLFPTIGVACPNHGHIHVGIPGLRKDSRILENILTYLSRDDNERTILKACCGYDKEEYAKVMAADLKDWVKSYLIVGDAKSINPTVYKEVVGQKLSVNSILHILSTVPALDYDWVADKAVLTENSHRTTVNVFNATKGSTIEFRVFRSSINPLEIYSCLKFAERVTLEMLKGEEGTPVKDLLSLYNFHFPKLNFDEELAKGWQDSRHSKGRCGCLKKWTGYQTPSEDPLTSLKYSKNSSSTYAITDIDWGYLSLEELCSADVNKTTVFREWEAC